MGGLWGGVATKRPHLLEVNIPEAEAPAVGGIDDGPVHHLHLLRLHGTGRSRVPAEVVGAAVDVEPAEARGPRSQPPFHLPARAPGAPPPPSCPSALGAPNRPAALPSWEPPTTQLPFRPGSRPPPSPPRPQPGTSRSRLGERLHLPSPTPSSSTSTWKKKKQASTSTCNFFTLRHWATSNSWENLLPYFSKPALQALISTL